MTGREQDLQIEGITLRVRESGDPGGRPVLHFHGTPGCRLEMAWADHLLADVGVRWVAFDRPGYGGSTPTPFRIGSVAKMALQVADQYGLERFRTSGSSGGGPFALATAAIAGERVQAVGVIAGPAPFQLVPGALDVLWMATGPPSACSPEILRRRVLASRRASIWSRRLRVRRRFTRPSSRCCPTRIGGCGAPTRSTYWPTCARRCARASWGAAGITSPGSAPGTSTPLLRARRASVSWSS